MICLIPNLHRGLTVENQRTLDEVFNLIAVAEEVNSNRLVVPGCTAKVFDLVSGRYRLAERRPRCLSPPNRQFRPLTLQSINVRWDLDRDMFLTGDF